MSASWPFPHERESEPVPPIPFAASADEREPVPFASSYPQFRRDVKDLQDRGIRVMFARAGDVTVCAVSCTARAGDTMWMVSLARKHPNDTHQAWVGRAVAFDSFVNTGGIMVIGPFHDAARADIKAWLHHLALTFNGK